MWPSPRRPLAYFSKTICRLFPSLFFQSARLSSSSGLPQNGARCRDPSRGNRRDSRPAAGTPFVGTGRSGTLVLASLAGLPQPRASPDVPRPAAGTPLRWEPAGQGTRRPPPSRRDSSTWATMRRFRRRRPHFRRLFVVIRLGFPSSGLPRMFPDPLQGPSFEGTGRTENGAHHLGFPRLPMQGPLSWEPSGPPTRCRDPLRGNRPVRVQCARNDGWASPAPSFLGRSPTRCRDPSCGNRPVGDRVAAI